MRASLNPRGADALIALVLLVGVFTACTSQSNPGDSADHTIRCKDVPGSDPVSCEGGYYVFSSRFDAELWADKRPITPDPTMMEAHFDRGWKTGVHYACNLLYGGPGPFGHWEYVNDPLNGSVTAHKVLAWVILGAEAPNEQPIRVTYRLCYSLADNGPPHFTP